jgi:hypothetical protein
MDTPEKIIEIKALFKEFLKEQGVKLAFNEEFKYAYDRMKDSLKDGETMPVGYYKTMNKYLERYAWHKFGAHRLISHGFNLHLSKKGREFWLNIHNEWCKKIAR